MIEYGDYRQLVHRGKIGVLNARDSNTLRELAERVKQIATTKVQEEKKNLWKSHNSLSGTRPMVLTFPEGAWREMLPYDKMTIEDPFWRSYEWYLKRLIYRGEHIRDDNVIEPIIEVPLVQTGMDWGIEAKRVASSKENGAWGFDPVIKKLSDIDKLQCPKIQIDESTTYRNYQAVGELFQDIIPIKIYRNVNLNICLVNTLAVFRGLENIMYDMIENQEWLHKTLSFMRDGVMKLMDNLEQNVKMDVNNGNDYVGSGGLGFTDELPSKDFDCENAHFKDMWGFAQTQEFAQVSPMMYEEYAVNYQIPLLQRYGMNCYGCCETMNDKYKILKKIPNLRRISISPWSDIEKAICEVGNKYILSWKPNPSQMVGSFNEESLRNEIKNTLKSAKGCTIEVILKDTHTVDNHPERIERWVDIANDVVLSNY